MQVRYNSDRIDEKKIRVLFRYDDDFRHPAHLHAQNKKVSLDSAQSTEPRTVTQTEKAAVPASQQSKVSTTARQTGSKKDQAFTKHSQDISNPPGETKEKSTPDGKESNLVTNHEEERDRLAAKKAKAQKSPVVLRISDIYTETPIYIQKHGS